MEQFNQYFKRISEHFKSGNARELTYRHDFQTFIENIFSDLKLSEENRSIKNIGRPDYTCFKNNVKIGYIETKDIGIDLDKELKGEQLKKYSEGAIPNIIITDYKRFILFRNQEVLFDVSLLELHELNKNKKVFDDYVLSKFKKLFESFLSYSLPTIKNATELAIQLSKRAKLLRDLSKEQLEEDLQKVKNKEEVDSAIYDFYGAFKELIKDANPQECVDAYAQTITYGLFLSKIGSHDGLSRNSAVTFIPSSIKIIKKIFMNITGDELPKNLSWIVDEIIDILNHSDIQKILSEFIFEGKKYRDPFIHFYEDFLKEYNPEARKHLGVYYTPEPVVSFITESINELLKKEFNKNLGFGDDSVKILDPATGTGTFIANAFYLALKEIRKSGMAGIEKEKIKNHLLKDFYAFEILVSPYVISHLKLTMMLENEGYSLKENDRVQVYLTNTLNLSDTLNSLSGFLKDLSQETLMANTIKREKPVLAILGNPPYSVSSSNKSEFITNLMKDYKEGLKEKNIQPLEDDYLKFIRFAQWKIEQKGEGVIGFITNNSFLDGLIHRQMRKKLLSIFDKIYILNLHGDLRKKEKSPDGSKDENVFDIQQGVAISLFIKNREIKQKGIFYYDLYGTRNKKYEFLYGNSTSKVNWEELKPKEPYYFLAKKDFSSKRKYDTFYKIDEMFMNGTCATVTGVDTLFVSIQKKEIGEKSKKIFNKSVSEQELKTEFGLTNERTKNIKEKRFKLNYEESNIQKYTYRPFDEEFIYYDVKLLERAREKIMSDMLQNNLGICLVRQHRGDFNHIFVSDKITDYHLLGGQTYLFPLYHYNSDDKNTNQKTLDGNDIKRSIGKISNLKEEFLNFVKEAYPNQEITPEKILSYIYAILHSDKYRKNYKEFLKIDFPRIPFVKDYKKFKKLSDLGNKLIDLHLLKTSLKKNIAKFDKEGDCEVSFVKYEDNKIHINKNQHFGNIKKDVWDFSVGDFQVLDKWLKTRKDKKLSYKEIQVFIQIVDSISETIDLMKKIDRIKID